MRETRRFGRVVRPHPVAMIKDQMRKLGESEKGAATTVDVSTDTIVEPRPESG